MGLIRFIVSPPERVSNEMASQIYMSGSDRIPWQCRVRQSDGILTVERNVDDSGSLHVPWDVDGYGLLTVSTGSLMEREAPYHLPLELARGKIAQVRNQLAEWQAIGLVIPDFVLERQNEAIEHFALAAVDANDSEKSVREAEVALRKALEAGYTLAACYSEQALVVRHRECPKLPTFLGADLGSTLLDYNTARQFLGTFNAANVPLVWREVETCEGQYDWAINDKQIEWCHVNGLTTCVGPLLQLGKQYIPDWLYLFEEDFDTLQSSVFEFIQATVERYRGKVQLWQCAGRVNTGGPLAISEEEKIRLTASVIELTHSLDPETPVVVSFDQPWAEYVGRQEMDFPAIHFADALVRANLGLGGIVLEINMGYHPEGTFPRDPIDFCRCLDVWSNLGKPVYVALCTPSSNTNDPLAKQSAKTLANDCSPKTQQDWISRFIPLLLSKSPVSGIIWNQLKDSEPHNFPYGGLFDMQDQPKPSIQNLALIRNTHLE